MRKALVVGINNYRDAPLTGCVRDATEIATLLRYHGDGSRNFDVNLQTNTARKEQLMQMIRELYAGDSDIALLYFAGHGFVNDISGFLVTPDFRKYDEGISMNDLLALANNSAAKNKIIILDCCHSGAIGMEPGQLREARTLASGVTILSACRATEEAMEERGRGMFTNLLQDALAGSASDVNGNITLGRVYAHIDESMNAWEQRPVFKTNITGFITLRKTAPRIGLQDLRMLTTLFAGPTEEHALDPSYEYTNDPHIEHPVREPFASEANVTLFKALQRMQQAGLVEPVGEPHMYWAAMNGKSCKLTPLGAHYWQLVRKERI